MECSIQRCAGVVVGFVLALSLSGCDVPRVEGYIEVGDMKIPGHSVPFWRMKEDYFEHFSHENRLSWQGACYDVDPPSNWVNPTCESQLYNTNNCEARLRGEITDGYCAKTCGLCGRKAQTFNSCMDPLVNSLNVCSGRGKCMPFNPMDAQHPIFFCECDEDWGGPECQSKRQRQSIAWFLSLVGGPLGLDEIYLGWPMIAAVKIVFTGIAATSAGVGYRHVAMTLLLLPWLVDVVRIGASPVRATENRVAADLPKWAFTVFTLLHFAFIAIILGVAWVYYTVTHKRFVVDYKRNYGTQVLA